MKVKYFRVRYLVKGVEHHFDFPVGTLISRMTVWSGAKHEIRKAHPDVNWSDISDISIEPIKVW